MRIVRLSTKLTLGFGVVTLLAVALGVIGYYGAIRNADSITTVGRVRLPSTEALLIIKEAATSIKSIQRTLLQRNIKPETRDRQFKLEADARKAADAARRVYERLSATKEEAAIWAEFVAVWEQWMKTNDEFMRLYRQLDALHIGDPIELSRDLATFRGQHYELQVKLLKSCNGAPLFEGGGDHTACAFGRWRAAHQHVDNPDVEKALLEIDAIHRRFHGAAAMAKEKIAAGDRTAATNLVLRDMETEAKQVFELFGQMQQTAASASELYAKLEHQAMEVCRPFQLKAADLLDEIARINLTHGHQETEQSVENSRVLKTASLVCAVLGVLLASAFAFGLTRSITGAIRAVTTSISGGAGQVAAAATQVSASSQSLAEGASEQAASLEETSASLEELTSVVKRNAESAGRAKTIAGETRSAADTGALDMAEMKRAMQEIKASSDDVAKIVKTIDEIAFQTNLLALNAAVEAARAGEAGAGFAVVADEVRSLAQRAAASSRETADRIQAAIVKSEHGVSIGEKVASGFSHIAAKAREVDQLVSEISAASNEQADGLSQVNLAVGRMDKVTQANASGAEECAAASEELTAQAESMRESVRQLEEMVGTTAEHRRRPNPDHGRAEDVPALDFTVAESRTAAGKARTLAKPPVVRVARRPAASDVLPRGISRGNGTPSVAHN